MRAGGGGGGSRWRRLFVRIACLAIAIDPSHRLVQLTHLMDWEKLIELVQEIRRRKLKRPQVGPVPHLRELIGVVVLMAVRKLPLREVEDFLRYYTPARYLCGLHRSKWTPDFTTVHDFLKLLGEDGVRAINEYVLKTAVGLKLADPREIVADTTAQEAAIPYPNEVGLMAAFLTAVGSASRRAGAALKTFVSRVAKKVKVAKQKVRAHRLFAKGKEAKRKITVELVRIVDEVQRELARALEVAKSRRERVVGYARVARAKVPSLHETMSRLLPQIRHWLRTGKVASGKIINVHIPDLYAIVRGKVGKTVEFGLTWGITRLRGGFIRATLAKDRFDLVDSRFVLRAVDDHVALFGKAPRAYAYDRGGWSAAAVASLKDKGVKEVGLAPRGKARWAVSPGVKEHLVRERAQVEGCIGTIKSMRYGFNRPAARSVPMMGMCGQRAVLGFNLNKLLRGWAERHEVALVA